MPITLIMGPMYSGKSTRLIEKIERYEFARKKCIIIRHNIDNRTVENVIQTHGGICYNKCLTIKCAWLNENNVLKKIEEMDVIAIDEAQFFDTDDMKIFLQKNIKKDIILTGLNGDFKQEPFNTISNLIPYCSKIIKLTSICECGNKADYTIRKQKNSIINKDQIVVGGKDMYVAICYMCIEK